MRVWFLACSYERRNIEGWLADHKTSPKTKQPLPHTFLTPNHSIIKQLIQDWAA